MSVDWFETVRQVVDPRVPIFNGVVERAVEQETIDHLDFDIPCSHIRHDEGVWGHNGPAAFEVTAKCGQSGFLCAGSVARILAAGGCDCTGCDGTHLASELSLTPISADR